MTVGSGDWLDAQAVAWPGGPIMSETMDPMATEVDQQELAQQLLAQGREQGIGLVRPGGLLNRLTKYVLKTVLEAEMDEHLGYGNHVVSGRGSGNSRNGR
jgi:putative transposase